MKWLVSWVVVSAMGGLVARSQVPCGAGRGGALSAEDKRALGYPEDALLNMTERAGRRGYSVEEHEAATEDGYLLTVFRVSRAGCARRGRPVLLLHGLMLSADAWLDAGDAALPYALADSCRDVWLGSARGSVHGRRHRALDPDRDAAFWRFSPPDVGRYDVPALMDLVLRTTGSAQLHFVGYSQGGAAFLMAASERPEYGARASLFLALAPVTRLQHTRSPGFRALADGVAALAPLLRRLGVGELFAQDSAPQTYAQYFCQLAGSAAACSGALAMLDSAHAGSLTDDTMRRLFAHFPGGASVQTFEWYSQGLNGDRFQQFDYGAEENLARYGTARPPEYALGAVATPTVLVYGDGDAVIARQDVWWAASCLPHAELAPLPDPRWNHFDMIYSQHIPALLLPVVDRYLDRYD